MDQILPDESLDLSELLVRGSLGVGEVMTPESDFTRRAGDLSLGALSLWMLPEDSGAIAVEERSFVAKRIGIKSSLGRSPRPLPETALGNPR